MPFDPAKALSSFLSISQAIAGETDYVLVLEKFSEELKNLVSHDHIDIVMLTSGGNYVYYEVGKDTSWGQVADRLNQVESSPIREVLWGKVSYILTADAWEEEKFHFSGSLNQPIFDAGLRSRIIVPMRVRGEVIGSLSVSSHSVGTYNTDNRKVAQGAADLLAPYLYALARNEEAQLLAIAESEANAREEILRIGALRLTEGMERERQRLGMDLHDQTLADLARLLRHISRLKNNSNSNVAEFSDIESKLATYLDNLRDIFDDLKPSVLQMFGFTEAVDAHLRQCADVSKPTFAVSISDETGNMVDLLPEDTRTSLYRIVQEACNNASKHSGANELRVDIKKAGAGVLIIIEDNGVGIETVQLTSTNGIGHMQTRAALISSKFDIRRRDKNGGTQIEILIPLSKFDNLSHSIDPTTQKLVGKIEVASKVSKREYKQEDRTN